MSPERDSGRCIEVEAEVGEHVNYIDGAPGGGVGQYIHAAGRSLSGICTHFEENRERIDGIGLSGDV